MILNNNENFAPEERSVPSKCSQPIVTRLRRSPLFLANAVNSFQAARRGHVPNHNITFYKQGAAPRLVLVLRLQFIILNNNENFAPEERSVPSKCIVNQLLCGSGGAPCF